MSEDLALIFVCNLLQDDAWLKVDSKHPKGDVLFTKDQVCNYFLKWVAFSYNLAYKMEILFILKSSISCCLGQSVTLWEQYDVMFLSCHMTRDAFFEMAKLSCKIWYNILRLAHLILHCLYFMYVMCYIWDLPPSYILAQVPPGGGGLFIKMNFGWKFL